MINIWADASPTVQLGCDRVFGSDSFNITDRNQEGNTFEGSIPNRGVEKPQSVASRYRGCVGLGCIGTSLA